MTASLAKQADREPPILDVRGLSKQFPGRGGEAPVQAVRDVSLSLQRGETLGIVGESGCGKSTLARLIMRLIEPSAGEVRFDGTTLTELDAAALRASRRDLQLIFQDPYASLDPRFKVGSIIAEPLAIHRVGDRATRRRRVQELLETVGLEPDAAQRYPHEFSGGQRQRIGIARAIALSPKLLIADEPVSALDVSIQSQILNLLMDLREKLALTYIFISHDLAVVEHISDRVAVMYLGQIVETSDAETLFRAPGHPYTEALISAIPQPDPARRAARIVLTGDLPNPEDPPAGCPFHPRCPKALPHCAVEAPAEIEIGAPDQPHSTRCHLHA